MAAAYGPMNFVLLPLKPVTSILIGQSPGLVMLFSVSFEESNVFFASPIKTKEPLRQTQVILRLAVESSVCVVSLDNYSLQ